MHPFVLDAVAEVTTKRHEPYHTIGVHPVTPVIGAEVSGVDLSRELAPDQFAEVKRAFLAHHVLVFRHQELTSEQHKRFAGCFGELHPVSPPPKEGDRYVLEISADKDSHAVDGGMWHADGTADEEPSLGSMLYLTRPPEIGSGGDTLFANMHLFYEMLSPVMKDFLGGLTAIHDGLLPFGGHLPPIDGFTPSRSEHPVVVRHPETDRRLLFVNAAYTSHIVQLSSGESRGVLDMLFNVIARAHMFNCRIRWAPNTLVFWDNRCVQHQAIWDYYPHSRYGLRVAIKGGRPLA